jgi:hypothetical protein
MPMWASDILEKLDREKVLEAADYCFHDVDAEFSKDAKRAAAVDEANGSGKKIWTWNPGWPSSRRGGRNRQHVVFVAKDEDELRGRLAVIEVMTS